MEHFSPLPPSPSPQAVLFHSEELASQPFPYVGLYESNTKLPAPLDVLTVHLSTHRILLAVPPNPPTPSAGPSSPSSSQVRSTFPHGLSIPLSHIRQTEFYAGFLTSSAKVTLYLASSVTTTTTSSSSSPIVPSSSPSILSPTPSSSRASSTGWPCPLCGFANPQPPPGATDKMVKCQMCGVSKEASMAAVPSSRPSSTHFSTSASTPSSTPPPPSPDIDPTSTGGEIACPICTFLNHSSLRECEMCSSPLPSRSTRSGPPPPSSSQPVVVVPSASIPGGGGPEKLSTVRLSFRRGGEKEFYKLLKRALADRAWAGGEPRLALNTSTTNGGGSPSASGTSTPVEGRPGVGGIDRILNTLSVEDATRSTSIDTSLRDLESLMAKASEMVKLASSLSLRLQQTNNSTPGDASSAASQEIHSTLLQLGLAAPAVTQDMVTSKEEGAYLRELARELGGLLTGDGGLMVDTRRGGKGKKGRGLIGLDEVWCAWNRARGVALIPPKTLPLLLPLLSQFTTPPISPLTLRRTRQTLLHTPYHSPSSFRSRLLRTLTAPAPFQTQPTSLPSPSPTLTQPVSKEGSLILATESLSLIELALAEDIGVGVAGELVWELEMGEGGEVVRDSQGGAGAGGERWWANWMKGVEWREVNDFRGR